MLVSSFICPAREGHAQKVRARQQTLSSDGVWDDLGSLPLDPKVVNKARLTEIEHAGRKPARTKIARGGASRRGMCITMTRCIHINKGDDKVPIYLSRFVAMDSHDKELDGLFAAIPPLEASRLLVSEGATFCVSGNRAEKVLMTNDVARGFL